MAIHSWSAGVFKLIEWYNGRLEVYKRGESGKDDN
jgi:hypothetical protein